MPFYAYEVALQVVECVAPLMVKLKERSADLADQIERAATSVVLNVAEGNRRTGKDRLRIFRIAEGSLDEVLAVLDCAQRFGWGLDDAAARAAIDREGKLLYGLTHPRPKSPC